MKLDIIENNGPDNLRDMLKAQLGHASDVSIAVAFVTQAGLDEILQPLRQLAVSGTVRIVTGLYQKITEPKALRSLLQVQEQTLGRFSVRLSTEPKFHRKVYLLNGRASLIAIVGSSNLTRDGMRSGGELNLVAFLPTGSPLGKKLMQAFEDDWEQRAVSLADEQVVLYEKARPEPPRRESYSEGQLAKILGTTTTHRQATENDQPPDYWRHYVDRSVKKKTEQIISANTNWDDKDYSWYAPGRHPYKIKDRIFLFDFQDQRLRLVEVKDIAHTKVATPDGRYFVAYRPLSRLHRRISKHLWDALAGEGITRKKARKRWKVSLARADRLRAIIRPGKKRL